LKVIDIVELQQQLQDISRMEPSYRGKELQRFLASDLQKNPAQWIPDARKFVLEQLGQCGRPCLPQIREMLDDEGFSRVGAELVRALGKAGGVEIGSELTLRLQEELRYWRTIGPQLPVGWWNVDITEDAPLRLRYMKTLEIIQGLRETHHPSAKASVITLRDFWRSLPQLNDPSGLDQMAEECEQYLRSQP
jgi:hypothetical protein